MKNLSIALLPALLLAVYSCGKEEATVVRKTGQEASGKVALVQREATFRALMDPGADTRTSLSGDGSSYTVSWSSNEDIDIDDVYITNGSDMAVYVPSEDSDGNNEATLIVKENEMPAIPRSPRYFAWYPFSIKSSSVNIRQDGNDQTYEYSESNKVDLFVDGAGEPASQYYLENDVWGFPMVAVSTNSSLSFKNLCGIIRLNIKASELTDFRVTEITLSSSNQSMSGSFSFDPGASDSEALATSLKYAGGGLNPVSLFVEGDYGGDDGETNYGVTIPKDKAMPFMIMVPPAEYEGLKITLTGLDGWYQPISKEYTLKAGKTVEVKRSMITDINLTASITPDDAWLQDGTSFNDASTGWDAIAGAKSNIKKVVFEVNSSKTSSFQVRDLHHGATPSYASFDEATGTVTISTYAGSFSISNMVNMFSGCTSLESIEGLQLINTDGIGTGVQNGYTYMFYNCYALKSVDVSGLQVDGRNLTYMFNACESLSSLDMSAWTGEPYSMANMLFGSAKLSSINFGTSLVIPGAANQNLRKGIFTGTASGVSRCDITCSEDAKAAFLEKDSSNSSYRASRLNDGDSKAVAFYINGEAVR